MTIDGADALAKLVAIAKPAMAELGSSAKGATNDLNRLEREFGSVGRAAAKQTGPITALLKQVDGLGDQYGQAARSAELFKASLPSVRTLNAQTAAINRMTAAYGRLTAAQTAAAAAPQPSVPPPTRGGGSGGGGSRGGGRGGIGGFLTGPVGLNSIALGASALPTATLAVTNLVGAVQQLAQAGLVLPGVWATAGASIGTAVLGFKGMGDAIKALNDGDLKKITEAMKDMDPAAQNVAKSVSKFTQGPLKDLTKGLQAKMFDGISQGFDDLVAKRMPNVTKGLGGISEAWNATLKQLLSTAGSDSTGSLLDRIFGNTAEGQKRANAAIDPLVKGIGTLAAAGSDAIPRLADALGRVATRFSNFITAADQDGRLAKWIDQGLTGVTNLGNTFLNLGKSITAITKAAGGDGGLLKLLETGSNKLATFLNSADGQQKLTTFFADARQRLSEWIPILGNVASIVGDVFKGFQRWGDVILPAVKGVTDALADMPGLVQGVIVAFAAFKTFTGLASLITSITSLGGLLDKLPGKAAGAAGGLNKAFAGIAIALPGILESLDKINDPDQKKNGSTVNPGTLGSTVLGGALAGSRFGLPGVLIGGAAGAAVAFSPVFANGTPRPDPNRVVPQGQLGLPGTLGPGFLPGDRGGLTPRDPGYVPPNANLPSVVAQTDASQRARAALDGGVAPFQKIVDQAGVAQAAIKAVGDAVTALPTGQVILRENTPEVLQKLEAVGLKAKNIDGQVVITADTSKADAALSAFRARAAQNVTVPLTAFPGFGGRTSGSASAGNANGGVLPGYSPGVDNMLVPMSGGEGVLIPEAMRALGSNWLYRVNSFFRPGISRRGYRGGGVVGFGDGGLVPDAPGGDNTVIGLLSQIRDALVGKLTGPLSDTATGVDALSGAVTGTGVTKGGRPFGGDIGKTFLAGIINGFGGDSRTFFPEFDQKGNPLGAALGAVGPVGNQGLAAALAKFATTG
ncbi:hypothetical protein H7J75_00090, partial [Mycolicibacterium canariasense]|nr:hypothetical protein [Mycolicibacterium canariasense]